MKSNTYTLAFAAAVCFVCALLLSGASMALKERQELNRQIDIQRNILAAAGIPAEGKAKEIKKLYEARIEDLVIDRQGRVVPDKRPADLGRNTDLLVLHRVKSADDPSKTEAYVYPISGKGLWSTLYGFLAVKPDGDEIVGITFYKHGETPGLGAEIEKEWFRKNFVGKHLHDRASGRLVGVEVVKGKARDKASYATMGDHMVDGISGATLTSKGVTKIMKRVPKRYEPFFRRLRRESTGSPPTALRRPASGGHTGGVM